MVSLAGTDTLDVTMMYDVSKTVEIELADYFAESMSGCEIRLQIKSKTGGGLSASDLSFTDIETDSTKLKIVMGSVTEDEGFQGTEVRARARSFTAPEDTDEYVDLTIKILLKTAAQAVPYRVQHGCGFGGSLGKAADSRACVDLIRADPKDPPCEYAKFNADGGYADCYCCKRDNTNISPEHG